MNTMTNFNLSEKECSGSDLETRNYEEDKRIGEDLEFYDRGFHIIEVKDFVERRLYGATRLIALFNQGKLTVSDLRNHRQNIKDDAGEELSQFGGKK